MTQARRRIGRWVLALLALGAAVVLVEALVVFAPAVDGRLGLLTGRALRIVRDARVGQATVAGIVDTRYQHARWRAYHRDYLTETYVRCDAEDRAGRPLSMVWIVTWSLGRYGLRGAATAHNTAAFNVAPSLYEPGHTLYTSPDIANR